MKKQLMIMVAITTLMSGSANAEGCLKGAAVGGVAGHYLGHHSIIGAIGGCVVGHQIADKEKQKQQRVPSQTQYPQSVQQYQNTVSGQPQIITNNQVKNK